MNKIDPELARVLVKRIVKAIEKARYEPATVDAQKVAEEIVRPYLQS